MHQFGATVATATGFVALVVPEVFRLYDVPGEGDAAFSETNAAFEVVANTTLPDVQEYFTVSNPVPGISGYQVLTVHYYDNYNWAGAKSFNTGFQLDAVGAPHILPTVPAANAFERLTGSKIKVIGQDKMLTSVFYYNENGHFIQEQKENIAGCWDVNTIQYDFGGRVFSGYLHHKNPESALNPETKTGYSNVYYRAISQRSSTAFIKPQEQFQRIFPIIAMTKAEESSVRL